MSLPREDYWVEHMRNSAQGQGWARLIGAIQWAHQEAAIVREKRHRKSVRGVQIAQAKIYF